MIADFNFRDRTASWFRLLAVSKEIPPSQTHRSSSNNLNMTALLKDPLLLTPLDNFLPQVTNSVNKILFFPTSGNERDAIVQHLRNAFARMMESLPWIAGNVTNIKHKLQHGRLAIAAPWMTVDDLLTVNDLEYLDYTKLKAEHFPLQALKEEEIWPEPKGRATLQARINFVRGGIILAVRAAHCVTDGHGLGTITKIWAAYCRGEDGKLLLGKDCQDRGRLMSGPPAKLSEFHGYKELPDRKQAPDHGSAHRLTKLCKWVSTRARNGLLPVLRIVSDLITYRSIRVALRPRKPVEEGPRQVEIFFFSASRLRELKEAVTASVKAEGQTESKAWISTHDALVSLLWCCITQTWKDCNYPARDSNPDPLRRLRWQIAARTTQPISVLAFFINARRLVKDPPLESYIGNVVLLNSLRGAFDDVNPTLDSVARHAYALRRKIAEYDEDYLMRLVGALGTVPDVARTRLSDGPFPQSTICINSWAAMDYYSTDWGSVVGGRPERVRLSQFQVDPFCLVLPKLDAKDGWSEDECGIEVAVNLKSTFMRRLKQDELFNRFAEWRCS